MENTSQPTSSNSNNNNNKNQLEAYCLQKMFDIKTTVWLGSSKGSPCYTCLPLYYLLSWWKAKSDTCHLFFKDNHAILKKVLLCLAYLPKAPPPYFTLLYNEVSIYLFMEAWRELASCGNWEEALVFGIQLSREIAMQSEAGEPCILQLQ